jgi:hypothetical protein
MTPNQEPTQTPEPTIPREARIAEHSSAIRALPDWTRIAQRTAEMRKARTGDKCPPRSLEERLWPFLLALRLVADSFDRAGMLALWAQFAHLVLKARLQLLKADLKQIAARISTELLTHPASEQQHARAEFARARRLRKVIEDALAQLEELSPDVGERAALAQALQDGTRCPTCLGPPVYHCRSGWLEGPTRDGARHPLSIECERRAEINGAAPRVWDRDSGTFVELTAKEVSERGVTWELAQQWPQEQQP